MGTFAEQFECKINIRYYIVAKDMVAKHKCYETKSINIWHNNHFQTQ